MFIYLFGSMEFVVWIMTYLRLAQLGNDMKEGRSEEKVKKGRKKPK